jgi:hypothetical protein
VKKVAGALKRARSGIKRRTPFGPNSPRDSMLGEVALKAPIQFE